MAFAGDRIQRNENRANWYQHVKQRGRPVHYLDDCRRGYDNPAVHFHLYIGTETADTGHVLRSSKRLGTPGKVYGIK